jgi:MFS superfamily sulfate permease-like transporter
VNSSTSAQRTWLADLISGFLVFLIALPLCLGISLASGYPAVAGILTAIIGGLLTPLISRAELTIKGPAAGLIVVALGAVTEFGFTGGRDPAADLLAYRMALGAGVAAGVLQICLGLLSAGSLAEWFPRPAVHGMLASIGIIIVLKQLPVMLGANVQGDPLALLARLPEIILQLNPVIACIGGLSLLILWIFPLLRLRRARVIPVPLVVLAVTVPLGLYLDLEDAHRYWFHGTQFSLGPASLVHVPSHLFSALTWPDFSGLTTPAGWTYAGMFALIGSLESLLSAKAIEGFDPWRRKTDLNRDLLAVGIGNTLVACIGGLPMISEIVRSKANVDNGGRTRVANMAHGMFLLLFVGLVPALVNHIPLAALAAMLVYTGFRLASPHELLQIHRVGGEQSIIFVITMVAVLATDLLVGIAVGVAAKLLIHAFNGAPLAALVHPRIVVEYPAQSVARVSVSQAAVFTGWPAVKREILRLDGAAEVEVDLSGTRLVDHTVMENLKGLAGELEATGRRLLVRGLEAHQPLSSHPLAARKKASAGSKEVDIRDGFPPARE